MPTDPDAAGRALLGLQNNLNLIPNVVGSIDYANLLIAINKLIDASNSGIVNRLYPIGSLYFNATNATNPGTLFGYGTWVAYASGRVPVGINAGDTDFATPEQTGGQKDVQTHEHMFGADDMISTQGGYTTVGGFSYDATSTGTGGGVQLLTRNLYNSANTAISGGTTNMNPYIVVYIWKRTA